MNRRTAIKAASTVFLPAMLGSAQATPPGAGATNVRDYGAVGDGIADDTAALQTALVAAQASAQRFLYLPAGAYRVSLTGGRLLDCTAQGLTVAGDGIGRSTIQLDPTVLTAHLRLIHLSAPNQTVRDMSILGNPNMSGTFDSSGVDIDTGALSWRCERLEFVNVYGYGAAGGNGLGCYQDPAIGGGWQWGVAEDCITRDSPLSTGFGTASNGNAFIRCKAIRCGNTGQRHGFYSQGGYTRYEQCYVEACGGFSFHAYKQSSSLDASGDIYDGCTSINPVTKHMLISGVGTLTRYVTIRNCLFKGSAEGLDTRVPALIEGCIFEDVRKTGQYAINVGAGGAGSIIRGNLIKNSYAINVGEDATAEGNTIQSTTGGTALYLNHPGAIGRGNRIVMTGLQGQFSATGLFVGSSGAGALMESNIVTVTSTGSCVIPGAGIFRGNILEPRSGAWTYTVNGGNFAGPFGSDVAR